MVECFKSMCSFKLLFEERNKGRIMLGKGSHYSFPVQNVSWFRQWNISHLENSTFSSFFTLNQMLFYFFYITQSFKDILEYLENTDKLNFPETQCYQTLIFSWKLHQIIPVTSNSIVTLYNTAVAHPWPIYLMWYYCHE